MTVNARRLTGARLQVLCGSSDDLSDVLALRSAVFRSGRVSDADAFDADALHVTVLGPSDQVLGAVRVRIAPDLAQAQQGYTAQSYDLSPLSTLTGPFAEVGRFCVAPGVPALDVIRLCWAGLTRVLVPCDVQMLFGCASFKGADPAQHAPALGWLAAHAAAPCGFGPLRHPLVQAVPLQPAGAPALCPPLPSMVRGYVTLGGWVSDHAVIDPDLETVHVFMGLRVSDIPPARAAALRRLADQAA